MGYSEIINYHPREINESKSTRTWLTNVYSATHFNSYVRDKIGNRILKRIIVNSETGSSWIFKRINRFQITFTPKKTIRLSFFHNIFFSRCFKLAL